jgi:hypothetical protein
MTALAITLFVGITHLQAGLRLVPVGPPAQAGSVFEMRVEGVPDGGNSFDPDEIRVDCAVAPKQGTPYVLPGFRYQEVERSMQSGREVLTPKGSPEWRLRFTPTEATTYALTVTAKTPTAKLSAPPLSVTAKPAHYRGFLRRNPATDLYLEYSDGSPFLALGENTAWPGGRGLDDYRDWIPAMKAAGMNYVRLWCSPWYFGCEDKKGDLANYAQGPLWALDQVMHEFQEAGIQVLLSLDYHGELNTVKDYWGGSDEWKNNAYNSANGGPCASPNDFFTSVVAKDLYKKRLRYLVGRYAAFANLGVWEFWNEIDNVLGALKAEDVVSWHAEMAAYLRGLDPYRHLITTSLSGRWWPELWALPGLDFAQIHSYSQASPAGSLAGDAKQYLSTFHKPVIVGEYGTDWRGYAKEGDPHSRGLHQAIWGTALSGFFGTAEPWWWENIHSDNLYFHFKALRTVLDAAHLGGGGCKPLAVSTPSVAADLGPVDPAGAPFDAKLTLDAEWGPKLSGTAVIRDRFTAGVDGRNLDTFVHGKSHEDLRIPFRILVHCADGARLILHLNSVSNGSVMVVSVNGKEMFRRALPNVNHKWDVNNQYNEDIPVSLPAGRDEIEVVNGGDDWFYLDWVKVEKALPAKRSAAGVPLEGFALGTTDRFAVWLLDPVAAWPANAALADVPAISEGRATVLGLRDGKFAVDWYDTRTGTVISHGEASSSGGKLLLKPPTFREDLAAVLRRAKA